MTKRSKENVNIPSTPYKAQEHQNDTKKENSAQANH